IRLVGIAIAIAPAIAVRVPIGVGVYDHAITVGLRVDTGQRQNHHCGAYSDYDQNGYPTKHPPEHTRFLSLWRRHRRILRPILRRILSRPINCRHGRRINWWWRRTEDLSRRRHVALSLVLELRRGIDQRCSVLKAEIQGLVGVSAF